MLIRIFGHTRCIEFTLRKEILVTGFQLKSILVYQKDDVLTGSKSVSFYFALSFSPLCLDRKRVDLRQSSNIKRIHMTYD